MASCLDKMKSAGLVKGSLGWQSAGSGCNPVSAGNGATSCSMCVANPSKYPQTMKPYALCNAQTPAECAEGRDLPTMRESYVPCCRPQAYLGLSQTWAPQKRFGL